MKMRWKTILPLIAALLLASCVSLPERIILDNPASSGSANFTIVDSRPAEQVRGGKVEHTYATWWMYGDDRFSVPPLRLLRSELAQAIPERLNGKIIRVEKLEVYVSQMKADRSQRSVTVPSTGSIGADLLGIALARLLIGSIEGNKNPPSVSAVIGVEIDGVKYEFAERHPNTAEDIDRQLSTSLRKAILGLAGEISQKFDKMQTTAEKPEPVSGGAQ